MQRQGFFWVASFVATVILSVSEVTSQNDGKDTIRYITLDDEVIPDAKLTITNTLKYQEYVFELADNKDEDNREYKISLFLTDRIYSDVDALYILAIMDNGKNISRTWNSSNYESEDCEIKGATEIRVGISDNWRSSAVLVATVYFESSSKCPSKYFTCKGGNDECQLISSWTDSEPDKYRCISRDLFDNGRPNCGPPSPCGGDVGEDSSEDYGEVNDDKIGWYDVQYLLTILLAGLFFILSPICIVIFLFYHRRMNAARNVQIERQRAVQVQRGRNEAGSAGGYTSGPRDDMPPSYEDVHDIKSPPPTFDSVLVTRPVNSETGISNPSFQASSSSSTI